MMSLFFTLGSTVHDWGWPKNGPFWTKKGQTWQACQRSKVMNGRPQSKKKAHHHVSYVWPACGTPNLAGSIVRNQVRGPTLS